MKRIFRRGMSCQVPDGTQVYPFLNPTDCTSDLPVGLFDGVSIAQGDIAPKQSSKIQTHPLITIVVWVIAGRLHLKMKDADHSVPYVLDLGAEDGAVARPGTFFQLINPGDEICRVLYIASPPYVYLQNDNGALCYDDAVVLDVGWEALSDRAYRLPKDLDRVEAKREEAIAAIRMRKGGSDTDGR